MVAVAVVAVIVVVAAVVAVAVVTFGCRRHVDRAVRTGRGRMRLPKGGKAGMLGVRHIWYLMRDGVGRDGGMERTEVKGGARENECVCCGREGGTLLNSLFIKSG